MAVVPNFGAANTSATTTTSNTVWSDAVSYTFDDLDQSASSVYALLWGGAFGANSNSDDYKVQILEGATVKASLNIEPREIGSPVDRDQLAGVQFFTAAGTPADTTFKAQIESEVSGTTSTAHNAMLRLLKLPTGSVYAESAAQQNYTSQGTFADKTGASISVSGTYVFIVNAEVQCRDITGFAGEIGLNIDGTVVNSLNCGTSDIDTWAQTVLVYVGSATSAAKVQIRQSTSDTAQLRIRNVNILAMPTSAFRNVYYQQQTTNSDGTQTTYTTAVTMTQTVAAGDHLVIAPFQLHSGSNSRSAWARLTSGGSQVDEHIREPGSSTFPLGAPTGCFLRVENYSAGSLTWTLDRKTETSDITRLAAGGGILVIDLEAPGGATTHTGSGDLAGQGSAIAGSASRFRAFSASGVLTGQGSSVTGSAARLALHTGSGALIGPGSTLSGSAARFRAFSGSGVLAGQGSSLSGSASRSTGAVTHAGSGALSGQGASLSGSANRYRAHAGSGVLAGSGASVSGVAARIRIHSGSGAILGSGAAISGDGQHSKVLTGSGALVGPGSSLSGLASHFATIDPSEDRTSHVMAEDRSIMVLAEDRASMVAIENRASIVLSEDRANEATLDQVI